MIVWHACKTKEGVDGIKESGHVSLGRNVGSDEKFAHVVVKNGTSLAEYSKPFDGVALDVIGADTNEAWILELEVPDDTVLEIDGTDLSATGRSLYATPGFAWMRSKTPITVLNIIKTQHVPDVYRAMDWGIDD